MERLTATAPDELYAITGEIHDAFFELDDVAFDRELERVVIPLRQWREEEGRCVRRGRFRSTWETPWYRWYLRVDQVTSLLLMDEAQLGTADFNQAHYYAEAGALTIECGLPVTITLGVADLDVTVEGPGERIGLLRYYEILGGHSYSGEVLPLPPGWS